MISFHIPGIPIAQPRQRHRVVEANGKVFAQNYTPKNDPVNAYKASCQRAAEEAIGGAPPLEGPVAMKLVFVMPRPAIMRWKNKPMERQWCPKGKDCDNLAKSVMDCLIGMAYHDDRQVCSLVVVKLYASGQEGAHTEVEIKSLVLNNKIARKEDSHVQA